MEYIKKVIIFRGTESYHFCAYFEKEASGKNQQGYLVSDVVVTVEPMLPYKIGSLEITQVALTIQGEASKVSVLEEKIRKHFMKAGG